MPYNWENETATKLAQPNILEALQNAPQQNNMNSPYQRYKNGLPQLQAQEQYPNAQYPRARQVWEANKEMYGNVLNPIGNAIKGVGKGAKEFAFGTPDTVEQYSKLTPQQQSIMQLLQQLGIYDLQNPYEGFEGIEQQALNQFNQQTVPGLAESFTRMTNGAMSSPSFASQLGQAGAGLQSDLSAQKAQYGQQNKQQTIQMLLSLLNPGVENIHRPQSNGIAQQAINAAVQAAVKAGIGG